MPSEDKPKSNMEIATDALKAEIAEEVVKPTPNWPKVSKLTTFLRSQRASSSIEDAIREEIAVAQARAPGVGGYVTGEDTYGEPNNFMPFGRVRTPSLSPIIPPEVQTLIDRVIEISPFQADKAKKMLECAELIEQDAIGMDEHDAKRDSRFDFAQQLREKAMDILRPELGDLPEEIKPAIRKLDLEDEDEEEGVIDAEFGAK